MRQSRIKEGSKGEFPHLQDTIWRQQNWNLANQFIGQMQTVKIIVNVIVNVI